MSPHLIFLSYAKEDKDRIDKIYLALKNKDLNPWMDKPPEPFSMDGIPLGSVWESIVRERVQEADLVLAFLSKKSVEKKGYVHLEFRLALDILQQKPQGGTYLIPVLLEDCTPPEMLAHLQWYPQFETGLKPLIEFIQKKVTGAPTEKSHDLEAIPLQNRLRMVEQRLICAEQLLASFIITNYERAHLQFFAQEGPFMADVHPHSSFEAELRHLLAIGVVDRHPGKGIRSLFGQSGKRNVKDHLYLTERGRNFLHLLQETEKNLSVPVSADA